MAVNVLRKVEVEKKDVKVSENQRNNFKCRRNFCLITHISSAFIQSQNLWKLFKA